MIIYRVFTSPNNYMKATEAKMLKVMATAVELSIACFTGSDDSVRIWFILVSSN